MNEALFYLASNFWLGASHAVLPGHGKTIAAAYVVGARGRPKDAVILGILVTLSHTSGVVLLFLVLASVGTTLQPPPHVQAYLALATGLVVTALGLWMVRSRRDQLLQGLAAPRSAEPVRDSGRGHSHALHEHAHHHAHGDPDHGHPDAPVTHSHQSGHEHEPGADHHTHSDDTHSSHTHGWGRRHTHRIDALAERQSSLPGLIGIAIADGLLPDPVALTLLASMVVGQGKVLLGLIGVVAYSVGFAAVLGVVGVVAAIAGQIVLRWLSGRWVGWLQTGAALLVVIVGIVLTIGAWRRF